MRLSLISTRLCLAIALMSAFASGLAAQQAKSKSEPVAAPAVENATAAPKVDATPFDDWRVECYDPAVNGMKCQLMQQLVESNLDKVVLITSLAYVPETDNTQIQIVLPLGFMLKRGVELSVDDYTSTVGVDRCTQQGCFIEGMAAPELINAMRKSNQAAVSITSDTGQTVRIPFSLSGFTKAYELVSERNKEFALAESKTDAKEAPAASKSKAKK